MQMVRMLGYIIAHQTLAGVTQLLTPAASGFDAAAGHPSFMSSASSLERPIFSSSHFKI